MLEKCVLTILELKWNQRLGHKKTKLNICHHTLTLSTYLQNRSSHVVERTRASSKCQKMKNARAKYAKIQFFIVKYANLWGFCYRRRRGCLSSLLPVALLDCLKNVGFRPINWHLIFFLLSFFHSYRLRNVDQFFSSYILPVLLLLFCCCFFFPRVRMQFANNLMLRFFLRIAISCLKLP